MSRGRAPAVLLLVLAAGVLGGCTGPDSTPWIAEQGPTAHADDFPDPVVATQDGRTDVERAVAEIESRLAARDEPLQVLSGTLPDGTDVDVEVVSITATETSVLARFRLLPADGQEVRLDVDGGLSGTLAAGDRSIADVELVDDATGRRLLPTVFRPDVTVEGEEQRCLCSRLPRVLPVEGVPLSAHYARPGEGFDLVRLAVPGLEQGAPVSVG